MNKTRESFDWKIVEAGAGLNRIIENTDDEKLKRQLVSIREDIAEAYKHLCEQDEEVARQYMQAAITGILASPAVCYSDDDKSNFGFGIIAVTARKIALACLEQDTALLAGLRARKYAMREMIQEAMHTHDE